MAEAAWFHCFSGIAGDMALGALVDAGADRAEVTALVRRLGVDGWDLDAEPVLRGGVAATKVHVRTADDAPHRTWREIRDLLAAADLPARAHDRAHATFVLLAAAEGALHRMPADEVHFHEVGALDAIVDVVGTCAALEVLDVDEVHCSPLTLGRGTVRAAHGTLPNPSPAVVRVLAQVGAPVHGVDSPVELTTPTGAALMAALATGFGPAPAMVLRAAGYGAGSADPDGSVNATQVLLGRIDDQAAPPAQPVVVLETNVDDATGEELADAVGALLAAGALDAWVTPVVMKKGRPGHVVAALAEEPAGPALAEALRAATGSLGVRAARHDRWPATRTIEQVEVDGHRVRVKVSPVRAKAEHDDVAAVAEATGRSPLQVAARAEAAWWAAHPPTD
ncbi:MAG: nickel pincer cofactor biosynthesis protein LarC [Iamia sp.]